MADARTPCPDVIAHRGFAAQYPENTLVALQAALDAGARYVEFDVQLTSDGVPVVFHDEQLARTTGAQGSVTSQTLARLRPLDAGYPARFGDRFKGTPISTLAETAAMLAARPGVTAFVEIKRESLTRFGPRVTVEKVMGALGQNRGRFVIISFDRAAVERARDAGAAAVGWVISSYTSETRREAAELAPGYLFCDRELLPPPPKALWRGPWRWAIYEVTSAEEAMQLAARGAGLIETMEIAALLERLGPPGARPHAG